MLQKVYLTASTNTALEQSIISGDYEVSTTDKSLVEEAKARAKEYLSESGRPKNKKK